MNNLIRRWNHFVKEEPHLSPLMINEFDWTQFTNGYLMQQSEFVTQYWTNETQSDIMVIHSNFLVGYNQKVQFFKTFGKWFVDSAM